MCFRCGLAPKMEAEAVLRSRSLLVLVALMGVLVAGWLASCNSSVSPRPSEVLVPTVSKLPVAFATRTFDPAAPPADMPQLRPGEIAICDSNFLSNATVGGVPHQTDATHATITISKVNVTLQLIINIWVPVGANDRLIEHEQGHRQISEYYYQAADKLVAQIAARYLGQRLEITGADLNAESGKILQQTAAAIAADYNKELNPAPTQLLYDDITDHGRSETAVQDAITHAIKNAALESPQSPTIPGN